MTQDRLPPSEAAVPVSRTRDWRPLVADYLGLLLVLALLVGVFGALGRNFLSATTFTTIANQVPAAVIIAAGMTLVLIVAGIDLSVGSVVALGSVVLGVLMVKCHQPAWVAVLACVGTGLACGLANGAVVVRWTVPAFIVTLGMMEIARGGAYLLSGSQTQYIGAAIEGIAETKLAGLSVPFLLALLVVVATQLLLSGTAFGRHLVAVGANEEAARLSGIDPGSVKRKVYALSGLLCAVAAVINTSRMSAADPNAGTGFELAAIAAVVIGGTSLMGGRGSVISSFFGVLVIAVLGAGLAQIGAQEPTKRLITGCVIVIAVIVDHYRRQGRRTRS